MRILPIMQQVLQEEIKDAQAKELMYAEEANRLGKVGLPHYCLNVGLVNDVYCIYLNRIFIQSRFLFGKCGVVP